MSNFLDSNQGTLAYLANVLPLSYHGLVLKGAKKINVNQLELFEKYFKMPCPNEFSNCAT